MSERTDEQYDLGRKVIRILIKRGLIAGESGLSEYQNTWEAAFEIIEEVKSNE